VEIMWRDYIAASDPKFGMIEVWTSRRCNNGVASIRAPKL